MFECDGSAITTFVIRNVSSDVSTLTVRCELEPPNVQPAISETKSIEIRNTVRE